MTIISALGGILLLITAAAGVIAFLRQQLSEANIQLLKETNASQELRLLEHAAVAIEQDKRLAKLQTQLDAAIRENQLLRDMVTGKDALAHLTAQVASLTTELGARYLTITGQHERIIELLGRESS